MPLGYYIITIIYNKVQVRQKMATFRKITCWNKMQKEKKKGKKKRPEISPPFK